jgi:hypothetical protein
MQTQLHRLETTTESLRAWRPGSICPYIGKGISEELNKNIF